METVFICSVIGIYSLGYIDIESIIKQNQHEHDTEFCVLHSDMY